VVLVMGLALFGIARTTGAGWMIVIVSGLAAVVVVGTIWPFFTLRGVKLALSAPPDGTVGTPVFFAVTLSARGRREGLALRLTHPESEWVRAPAPADGEVMATPQRRGVVTRVDVELRSAAPLALVSLGRRRRVRLPRPLEVGPRPHEQSLPRAAAMGAPGGDPQPFARVGSEIVRSLREYVPGDPSRLVHWAGTARRGDLMVKELEEPDRPRVTVIVDLRGPEDDAEDAASRAAGLAGAVLRNGLSLFMLTAEPGHGVAAPVHTAREAGRRLARAIAAAPPEGPIPRGSHVVRITPSPKSGSSATNVVDQLPHFGRERRR